MKRTVVHIIALTLVLPLLALLGSGPARAQGPVFKPSQVTEGALIDALGVVPGAGAEPPSRSIRMSVKPTTAAKAAAPGKASLLITFATGSSELTPETIRTLEILGKALQSDRLTGLGFRVEGHADPRGAPDLNQKLSQERAQAVVAYLTGPLGVSAERLAAIGKGSSEPINPDRPEAAENRRVTIVTNR